MWVREVSRFCTMRALNNFPSIAIFTLYYYNNLEEFHIMKPIFFLMGIVYILRMTIMSSDQLIMLIILNINVIIFFFFTNKSWPE